MLSNLFYFLRGCLTLLLLAINMIFSAIIILIATSIAWILPRPHCHHKAMEYASFLPAGWMYLNKLILQISTYGKWDVHGAGQLKRRGWYVLISNHSSWFDIPVLGSIFSFKIPLLKFFMKKELLWQLPIAGLDCYLLGYPFMARHSRDDIRKNPALKGKDIETTKKASQKFKIYPSTFMNFVEGTRFSKAKRERQNSPYQHLLKPKAAGVAIVLTEMQEKLDGIVNVTIHYDAKDNNLWHFLCGKINKITVRYEVIPVTKDLIGNFYDDRDYRKHFQNWLNTLWEKKDNRLEQWTTNDEN